MALTIVSCCSVPQLYKFKTKYELRKKTSGYYKELVAYTRPSRVEMSRLHRVSVNSTSRVNTTSRIVTIPRHISWKCRFTRETLAFDMRNTAWHGHASKIILERSVGSRMQIFLTIRPVLLFCTPNVLIRGQGRCPRRLCHVPNVRFGHI